MIETIMGAASAAVPAIVVLGILILIHEGGHFFVAKRAGVKVLKFSLGFGPKLVGYQARETEYVISAVPFGGYVKMAGEDPGEETPDADRGVSFSEQSVLKRAAIVAAGPLTNVVAAFVLFALVFVAYGVRTPSDAARVGGISAGMPAAAAGLVEGDLILAVDSTRVESWDELSRAIRSSGGRALVLDVERGGSRLQVAVTPKAVPDRTVFGEVLETKTYVIGIERAVNLEAVDPATALLVAGQQSVVWAEMIVTGLYKMATGRLPMQDIGGPLEIARQAGRQASRGLEPLLMFMAIISLNLGLLNLLPIPILDGGHLLFLGIEAVLRRPVDVRYRELAQQAGLFILLALMAFAFYNDILRVVGGLG